MVKLVAGQGVKGAKNEGGEKNGEVRVGLEARSELHGQHRGGGGMVWSEGQEWVGTGGEPCRKYRKDRSPLMFGESSVGGVVGGNVRVDDASQKSQDG